MGNFINHIETNSFNGIFNQHILDLAGIDKKVGEKLTGQELDKIYTKTYEKVRIDRRNYEIFCKK